MHHPLEKAALIGKGLTADVYAWGPERVVKLFQNWRPASDVEREYRVSRILHSAGLPVPATYEMIEVDGRRGIVFERVDGISMYKRVEAAPWKFLAAARQLAELHAQLHGCVAPSDLPTQQQQMESCIRAAKDLPEADKQAAQRCLIELPEGNTVCHGDFHPENVLLTSRGPIIIDWSRGTRGNALADVARTSMLFQTASLPPETPLHMHILLKTSRALLHATYLKRYLQLRPGTRDQIDAWRPIQLAAASAWRASQWIE
jgi:uncharacterized protein (TIGR02172 family)